MKRNTIGMWSLIAAGFALLSLIVYLPYAPWGHWDTSLVHGDAIDFTYFLGWGHHVLSAGAWRNFFMVPISHPLPAAGGLTDILPGLALATWPLRLFTDNPVLVFNLTRWLCGLFVGLAMVALARTLRLSWIASVVCGVFFVFSDKMIQHAAGHLSVLASFGLPLAFLFAVRCFRKPSVGMAAASGLLLFLQGAISSRIGLLGFIGLILYALGWLAVRGQRQRGLAFVLLLSAWGLALGGVWAVYRPAQQTGDWIHASRSVRDAIPHSLDLAGLVKSGPELQAHVNTEKEFDLFTYTFENSARIGWLPLLLIVGGFLVRRRRESTVGEEPVGPWLGLALISLVFALGPVLLVGGEVYRIHLPWRWIQESVSPLAAFRTVGRFSLLMLFAVSILAGMGLDRLLDGLHQRTSFRAKQTGVWLPHGLGLLILGAAVVSIFPLPTRVLINTTTQPNLAAAYRGLPASAVVLEVPFNANPLTPTHMARADFPRTVWSISGGMPNPVFATSVKAFADFPSPQSLDYARFLGVTHIVAGTQDMATALEFESGLIKDGDLVFRLRDTRTGVDPEEIMNELPLTAKEWRPMEALTELPLVSSPLLGRYAHGSEGATWGASLDRDEHLPNAWIGRHRHGFIQLCLDDPLDARRIQRVGFLVRYHRPIDRHARSRLHWAPPDGWYQEDGYVELYSEIRPDGEQWLIFDVSEQIDDTWSQVQCLRWDPELPIFTQTTYEVVEVRIWGE